MQKYKFVFTGVTPLILHWDNIPWAEELDTWRKRPENTKFQKKGDDRSPAWSWIGCLYNDGEHVALPTENIMRAVMEGGAAVPVPGGRSGKTFKAQTQSGMAIGEEYNRILVNDKPVKVEKVLELADNADFSKHQAVAAKLGFSLFIKRARIGQSKHVRVRPRFNTWKVAGVFQVWDEQITEAALRDILKWTGEYKGLGDWRPSSKTPGPYGRFTATIEAI